MTLVNALIVLLVPKEGPQTIEFDLVKFEFLTVLAVFSTHAELTLDTKIIDAERLIIRVRNIYIILQLNLQHIMSDSLVKLARIG